jgi:glycine cleavage system H protein
MTQKFTKDHEYIRLEGGVAVVGITPYAQEQLGDIVFVELPAVGKVLKQGDEAAVVESVKAASEIYAPASGTVTEVNTALTGEPGLINTAPEGDGWIYKLSLSDPSQLDGLLDAAAYAELTK